MASIVTNLTCELTTPVSVVFLPGNMFSMDNGGNIINVFVVQNGVPATLGGSVSANVIRSDGTTVAITGALEGNKAYIILPQACYAVPGIIHIVMKITEGTTITTIAAITANVYQSSTDAIVDPGTLVPSVAALIAQIEAAVDSIPVDYSGLLLTLAKDYTQKPYIVGEYAWQGGVLKRCIVPITTAETYTAAHWTNAVLGDDVSALKSAFERDTKAITGNIPLVFDEGVYYKFTNQGANVSLTPTADSGRAGLCVPCSPGDKFTVKVYGGGAVVLAYGFCDANGIVKEHANTNVSLDGDVLTAPADSEYFVLNNLFNRNTDYWAVKGTPLLKDFVNDLSVAVDTIGGISASDYSNLLANVDINCRANFLSTAGWTDTPPIKSGVFINNHVNTVFNIQYFITHAKGIVYNRIVRRSNHEVYRDWVAPGFPEADPVSLLNVVVLGDSICRGGRNSGKGFIGDVGCQYVNMGVGGATISNKTDSSSVTDAVHAVGAANIPDQLVKYATECTGEDWYIVPDVIIAEGGINDMSKANLGTVPTSPAHNDTEAAALAVDTLCGGLEYLFYQMIKLYPLAKRFFLISNRVNTRPWTANTGETVGYTQTEMANAIKAVCAVYSVKVIDVFNESPLDSYFSQYVSPTAYSEDHSVTDLYCIDHDKLHPLALGYKVGYAPLVKGALQSAIKFN